jgi:hypothetical protein
MNVATTSTTATAARKSGRLYNTCFVFGNSSAMPSDDGMAVCRRR